MTRESRESSGQTTSDPIKKVTTLRNDLSYDQRIRCGGPRFGAVGQAAWLQAEQSNRLHTTLSADEARKQDAMTHRAGLTEVMRNSDREALITHGHSALHAGCGVIRAEPGPDRKVSIISNHLSKNCGSPGSAKS
jgi:hypothetical protein